MSSERCSVCAGPAALPSQSVASAPPSHPPAPPPAAPPSSAPPSPAASRIAGVSFTASFSVVTNPFAPSRRACSSRPVDIALRVRMVVGKATVSTGWQPLRHQHLGKALRPCNPAEGQRQRRQRPLSALPQAQPPPYHPDRRRTLPSRKPLRRSSAAAPPRPRAPQSRQPRASAASGSRRLPAGSSVSSTSSCVSSTISTSRASCRC